MILLGLRKSCCPPRPSGCASCSTCSANCPQDVDFSNIMMTLRDMAVNEGYAPADLAERIERISTAAHEFRQDCIHLLLGVGTPRPRASGPTPRRRWPRRRRGEEHEGARRPRGRAEARGPAPRHPPADRIGSVLVVGAGIAGIQSSLDLANAGYKVYLVESLPSIGGAMTMLDKTFPTNDCSMCIVSPKLVECARHPNIETLTYSEVEALSGEAGASWSTSARRPAPWTRPSAPAAATAWPRARRA